MALADAPVNANIPVLDMDRAKKFYQEKLGLKPFAEEIPGGVGFEAGKGTMLFLYQRGPSKAEHTLASWMVDDLAAEMKALRDKGITFEEYNIPEMGIKTDNGVATWGDMKSAWFKDSEGNILSLAQNG